jgi:hypothetical protein
VFLFVGGGRVGGWCGLRVACWSGVVRAGLVVDNVTDPMFCWVVTALFGVAMVLG